MKLKLCGIILVLFFSLTGCNTNKQQETTGKEPESISFDYNVNYSLEEIPAANLEIGATAGICIFNDTVVVCDKKNSCLVLLDKDCNFIRKVGNLGMGPLEFTEPTGITIFGSNLYILDAGNNRIQILDSDYKYIDEISLKDLIHKQGASEYIDLAIDKNGIIYVSTFASVLVDAHIFRIEDKEIQELEQTFIGHLCSYDGTVYATNIQELRQEGNTETAFNGKNSLYRVDDRKLIEIKEFPYKYAPSGICIYNNKLYTVSGAWMCMDIFTMEGDLEEAVIAVPTITLDRYVTVYDENHIYCTDMNGSSIFKITKAELK